MRTHTHSEASRSRSVQPSIPFFSFSTLSVVLLALPSLTAAFECNDIQAQNQKFNLEPLGGPKVVHWFNPETDEEAGLNYNYTFTIDLCKKLEWHKGGSLQTECHHGTRICAIQEKIPLEEGKNSTIQPIEIAGTYTSQAPRTIDAHFELLRNSKSHSDSEREGLRAELHGGRYPFSGGVGTDQMAIIEFVCDAEREGTEGDEEDSGEKEPDDDNKEDQKLRTRDGNDKKDTCEDTNASLRFCGYKMEQRDKGKKAKVLRLEWRTKYACENAPDVSGPHWGFFTWFIIILFLATAAYLIFGSWLNYNRYGARGWDLLPHGDTIRDIPYILKDWARHVANTLQGPGSRGGYSAV